MKVHFRRALVPVCCALMIGVAITVQAQIKYNSGQNVQPGFDGWIRNADGSATLYFGYLNRNYEETPIIPIGPSNNIEPGGPDRGQPTFFLPRRQRYVFTVKVPKEWDAKREVIWTLTANGKTDKIFGALNPEDEIVERNVMTNGGFGSPAPGRVDENKPPTVQTSATRSVALPAELTLTAVVTDDGLPRPRNRGPIRSTLDTGIATRPIQSDGEALARPQGLRLGWFQYRGPAVATIEPSDEFVVTSGKDAVAKVRFSAPGTYVLRGLANDGQFRSREPVDVTITVTGAPAPRR
jgi:hypothetical protein